MIRAIGNRSSSTSTSSLCCVFAVSAALSQMSRDHSRHGSLDHQRGVRWRDLGTTSHLSNVSHSNLADDITPRALSTLSPIQPRPTLRSPLQSRATTLPGQISPTLPSASPYPSALQVRTAKRDTFNPHHRIRKRRHGYLSRIRTRNGRRTLLRRRMKGRLTLSH